MSLTSNIILQDVAMDQSCESSTGSLQRTLQLPDSREIKLKVSRKRKKHQPSGWPIKKGTPLASYFETYERHLKSCDLIKIVRAYEYLPFNLLHSARDKLAAYKLQGLKGDKSSKDSGFMQALSKCIENPLIANVGYFCDLYEQYQDVCDSAVKQTILKKMTSRPLINFTEILHLHGIWHLKNTCFLCGRNFDEKLECDEHTSYDHTKEEIMARFKELLETFKLENSQATPSSEISSINETDDHNTQIMNGNQKRSETEMPESTTKVPTSLVPAPWKITESSRKSLECKRIESESNVSKDLIQNRMTLVHTPLSTFETFTPATDYVRSVLQATSSTPVVKAPASSLSSPRGKRKNEIIPGTKKPVRNSKKHIGHVRKRVESTISRCSSQSPVLPSSTVQVVSPTVDISQMPTTTINATSIRCSALPQNSDRIKTEREDDDCIIIEDLSTVINSNDLSFKEDIEEKLNESRIFRRSTSSIGVTSSQENDHKYLEGLTLIITHENHPDHKLSEENFYDFRISIAREIRISREIPKWECSEYRHSDGSIVVVASDCESKEWLCRVVQSNKLLEDIPLKIQNLYTVSATIPLFGEEFRGSTKILEELNRFNSLLETDQWRVVAYEEHADGKECTIFLQLLQSQMEVLSKIDFKPYYPACGRVKFRTVVRSCTDDSN